VKQNSQCTYNITLWDIPMITFAMET